MPTPLPSAPALLLPALLLLRATAPTRAPAGTPPGTPAGTPTLSALPRCPPLMLQLLRAPPAPLRGPAAAALSLSPHGSQQNGSRWALSFDISSLSSSQEVNLAQLRVHLPSLSPQISLDIYHSRRWRCRGGGTCTHQLFLGTVMGVPSPTQTSWKVFEVTHLLRSWLHQTVAPKGWGRREASDTATSATSTAHSPTINTHFKREPTQLRDVRDRVLLLIFSKDKSPGEHSLIRTAQTSKHVVRDRGSRGAWIRRHRRNRLENPRLKVSQVGSTLQGEENKSLCRRVDMLVDFEQTAWGSWIVYPKKYNAYRCEGRCPSPVDETFKPTNHAYIQSLLQLYKPNQVPCPSCSPVRMSPLSMLYYEKGELVVRHHEDMVIEECGCN
ncbi:nodal homolog [Phaethornis superciliosus]